VSFGSSFNSAPTTFAPLGERFFTGDLTDLAPGQSGQMTVTDFGTEGTNPGELGLLLITNGDRGEGARGGATLETEAILFEQKPPKGKGKGKGKDKDKGKGKRGDKR
jgi:hypothetical protein